MRRNNKKGHLVVPFKSAFGLRHAKQTVVTEGGRSDPTRPRPDRDLSATRPRPDRKRGARHNKNLSRVRRQTFWRCHLSFSLLKE